MLRQPAAVSAPQRRTGGRRYRTDRPQSDQPSPEETQRGTTTTTSPAGIQAGQTLAGYFVICLVSCLLAAWLHLPVLAGLGFCAGSALAARLCRPAALLWVVVAVPAVFAVAQVLAQLATLPGDGRHGMTVPLLEGTLLTLAAVAPWLFAGTAAAVAIGWFRGLPRCFRELRGDLTGQPRRPAARRSRVPRVHPIPPFSNPD